MIGIGLAEAQPMWRACALHHNPGTSNPDHVAISQNPSAYAFVVDVQAITTVQVGDDVMATREINSCVQSGCMTVFESQTGVQRPTDRQFVTVPLERASISQRIFNEQFHHVTIPGLTHKLS
jgi:hypothetical protein